MHDEPLDDDEIAILQVADLGLSRGELANAIRGLELSETAYFRRLNWLLDTARAAKQYPGLINRLRRLRESRSAARRR